MQTRSMISDISKDNRKLSEQQVLEAKEKKIQKQKMDFLNLFLKAIECQDPLEPMKTEDIARSTLALSSLDLQLQNNADQIKLIDIVEGIKKSLYIGHIGKVATYEGDVFKLSNGESKINFNIDAANVEKAEIVIEDKENQKIFSKQIDVNLGQNSYIWNGENEYGRKFADDFYRISIYYRDADNKMYKAKTQVEGNIESIISEGKSNMATINGKNVGLDKINSIYNRPIHSKQEPITEKIDENSTEQEAVDMYL